MMREAELAELQQQWAAENDRIMREHPAPALPAPEDPMSGGPGIAADPALAEADPVPVMAPQPEIRPDPVVAEAAPGSGEEAAQAAHAQGGRFVRDIDESQAPLIEHLIELRRRLLYCVIALAVTFGIGFYFAKPIFSFLVQPLVVAGQSKLIFTQIFEAFFVQVKVAFFTSLMLSFPVTANQLWQFVAPGLYRAEKKALLPFILATPLLFLSGAALAYYVAVRSRSISC